MRNTYSGACFVCRVHVPTGGGWFQKNLIRHHRPGVQRVINGQPNPLAYYYTKHDPAAERWILRCLNCKDAGNQPLTASGSGRTL